MGNSTPLNPNSDRSTRIIGFIFGIRQGSGSALFCVTWGKCLNSPDEVETSTFHVMPQLISSIIQNQNIYICPYNDLNGPNLTLEIKNGFIPKYNKHGQNRLKMALKRTLVSRHKVSPQNLPWFSFYWHTNS